MFIPPFGVPFVWDAQNRAKLPSLFQADIESAQIAEAVGHLPSGCWLDDHDPHPGWKCHRRTLWGFLR
jgi:hypothetical protein